MVGNIKTLRRYKLLRKLLDDFGLEKERLRLEWISASEADKYVRVVKEMVEGIRGLPSPPSAPMEVEATA
jgi:F420-non-reducing hydrogenase iron-sulfur subunit